MKSRKHKLAQIAQIAIVIDKAFPFILHLAPDQIIKFPEYYKAGNFTGEEIKKTGIYFTAFHHSMTRAHRVRQPEPLWQNQTRI